MSAPSNPDDTAEGTGSSNNKLFCANPGDAATPLGRAAETAGWLVGQASHLLRMQLPDFTSDALKRFVGAKSWEERLQMLVTPIATDPYTLQRLVRSLCGDFFVAGEGGTAVIRGFDTFIKVSTTLRARGRRTTELFFRTTKGSSFMGEPRKYGACPFGTWEELKDIEPHVVARDIYPAQRADIDRMVDAVLAARVGDVTEAGKLFLPLVWDLIVYTSYGVPPGAEVTEQLETFMASNPAFDRSLRVGSGDRAGDWDEKLTAQHKFMQDWSHKVVRERHAALAAGGPAAEKLSEQTDVLTHVLKSDMNTDLAHLAGALHAVFLAGFINMHSAVTGAVVANALQSDAIAAYVAGGDDTDARVDHVVRETLRLHTAIPATRIVQEEDDFKLGDQKLKTGGTVLLTTYGINTDPRSWDEPDEFRPARFQGRSDDLGFYCTKGFAPFGAAAELGGRQCSGRYYMVHLMRAVIAKLLCDYKLEKVGKKGFFDFKQMSGSAMYIGECDIHVQKRK